jgi:hypothetical protein
MKQCPVCKTTYTDTTLLYCLADGSRLSEADDEEPTVVDRWEPVPATVVGIGNAPTSKRSWIGTYVKVLIVLIGLLVVSAFIVAAAVLFYLTSGERASNKPNDRVVLAPSPTPEPTPAKADDPDESEKELIEQIANLEKMIREQAESDDPDNIPLANYSKSARVNSPNDGFLALRSYPNSQAGSRILKIPHASNIRVGMCLNTSRLGNRSGRWCQASYNGYSGWVFDAWLDY